MPGNARSKREADKVTLMVIEIMSIKSMIAPQMLCNFQAGNNNEFDGDDAVD